MVFILISAISSPALAQGQTLLSIDVTPANPTITVGQTQQFTATGTFSDGMTQVLGVGGGLQWSTVTIQGLPTGASLASFWTGKRGEVYVWAVRSKPGSDIPESWLYKTSDNGATWNIVLSLPDSQGSSLWGTGPAEVFASATRCPAGFAANCGTGRGTLAFRSVDGGVTWVQQTLPVADVQGFYAFAGRPNDVHATAWPWGGGTNGWFLKFDGSTWAIAFTDNLPWPAEMWGVGLVYISSTEIYKPTCWGHWLWNGSTWNFVQGFDFCDASLAWGMRDAQGILHLYVTGNNNFSNGIRIWKFTESSIGSMTGSWGSKFGYVFSDGNSFNCGSGYGIWGSSGNDIWVVGNFHPGGPCTTQPGGEGRIYHYNDNGTSWMRVITPFEPIPMTRNVWGTASDDVWVTNGTRLLHFSSSGAAWTSSNTAVAMIDADGLATGLSPGTTTITAASGTISNSTTLTVAATDSTPPVIVPTITPAPNAAGWNNSSVTVSWSVTDPESGISSSSGCTSSSLITETAGTVLTCIATNGAGLSNSAFVTIKIDKTPPVISAASSPLPNGAGWNNTNVTVSYTCTDSLSGISSCSGPATVTTEGTGQVIAGSAKDAAGNSAVASVTLNIDKTPPVVAISGVANGATYTLGCAPAARFTATDTLSGVAVSNDTLTGGNGVGAHTYTATATDVAGNISTKTVNFSVIYSFIGFLQPINSDGSSIFKLGSTVPIKYQLTDCNGIAVTTAAGSLAVLKITDATTGSVVEMTVDSTGAANTDNLFRYSAPNYIYNLDTKPYTSGTYRVQATLDDGTVHIVNISLKTK